MATATTLAQAAQFTPDNLLILWTANTLQARLISFWTAGLAAFPDAIEGNRPVANWLTILAARSTDIPLYDSADPRFPPAGSYEAYLAAVDYLYRLLKLAAALNTQTPVLVSTAQRTALLAAYNSFIGS